MDSGRRWIAAGNGLRPEMVNKRWIPSGGGSRQDMDRDQIWMDDRRWMTGDGSRETDDNQSPFLLKLRSCNRAQICRYTMYRRYGSTEYDTEHYSEIPNYAATSPSSNAEYDHESDPESQLQCRYRTSRTRLIFDGATIFKEGDDTAGFATTLTANNYRTGSAGTKHCEMHSPIEKASSGKRTWRRSNNCTPRTAKKCTQGSDGKRTYR